MSYFFKSKEENQNLSAANQTHQQYNYGSTSTKTLSQQFLIEHTSKKFTAPAIASEDSHDCEAHAFIQAVNQLHAMKEEIANPDWGGNQDISIYHQALANLVIFYDSIMKMSMGNIDASYLNSCNKLLEEVYDFIEKDFFTILSFTKFRTLNIVAKIKESGSLSVKDPEFEPACYIFHSLMFLVAIKDLSSIKELIETYLLHYNERIENIQGLVTIAIEKVIFDKPFWGENPYACLQPHAKRIFLEHDKAIAALRNLIRDAFEGSFMAKDRIAKEEYSEVQNQPYTARFIAKLLLDVKQHLDREDYENAAINFPLFFYSELIKDLNAYTDKLTDDSGLYAHKSFSLEMEGLNYKLELIRSFFRQLVNGPFSEQIQKCTLLVKEMPTEEKAEEFLQEHAPQLLMNLFQHREEENCTTTTTTTMSCS